MKYEHILEEVDRELQRAKRKFPDMQTNHDGYGVIKEEFDEFWDEIKKLPPRTFNDELRMEAIQLAAMCVRFVTDRCMRGQNIYLESKVDGTTHSGGEENPNS